MQTRLTKILRSWHFLTALAVAGITLGAGTSCSTLGGAEAAAPVGTLERDYAAFLDEAPSTGFNPVGIDTIDALGQSVAKLYGAVAARTNIYIGRLSGEQAKTYVRYQNMIRYELGLLDAESGVEEKDLTDADWQRAEQKVYTSLTASQRQSINDFRQAQDELVDANVQALKGIGEIALAVSAVLDDRDTLLDAFAEDWSVAISLGITLTRMARQTRYLVRAHQFYQREKRIMEAFANSYMTR